MEPAPANWLPWAVFRIHSAGRQTAEPSGFSERTHFGKYRQAAPIFTSCLQAGITRPINAAEHGLPTENISFLWPRPDHSYGLSMTDAGCFGDLPNSRFN